LDFSKEDLIEKVLRDGVQVQINFMKQFAQDTATEEYQKFASTKDTPARSFPPLTQETEDQIRTDLLAYRRAQYERGEFDFKVYIFGHNKQIDTVIDMATGEVAKADFERFGTDDDYELNPLISDYYRRSIEERGEDQFLDAMTQARHSAYQDAILKDIYM
jgi:hypothetical protein